MLSFTFVVLDILRSMMVYEGIPSVVPNVSLLLRYVQVEAVLVQVLLQMLRYVLIYGCAIVALLLHYVALLLRYCCAMLSFCCAMLRYFAQLLCYPSKQCGSLRPKKVPGGRHTRIGIPYYNASWGTLPSRPPNIPGEPLLGCLQPTKQPTRRA